MTKKYAILALTFLLGLPALPCAAFEPSEDATQNVIISEINWAGSSLSTSDEWLELYNPTGQSVDLSGWVLTGCATSGNALSLEAGATIESESTLLVSNYPLGHEKTTLNIEPDLTTSSLSLSNSSLEIILAQPDGLVIDEVNLEATSEFGSSEPIASMERDLNSLAWQTASTSVGLSDTTQLGTPGYVELAEIASEDEEVIPETEEVNSENEEVIEEVIEEVAEEIMPGVEEITQESEEVIQETEEVTQEDEEVIQEAEGVTQEDEEVMEEVSAEVSEEVQDAEEAEDAQEAEDAEEATEEESESESIEDEVEAEVEAEAETEAEIESETEPDSYYFGDILINEIVSNPSEGEEWIELYNPGSVTISLDGWFVADETERATFLAAIDLAPGDYYVLEAPKGQLNNSGDSVFLYDPLGQLIDRLTYGTDEMVAPDKGESLARDGDSWFITSELTAGQANPEAPSEPANDSEYESEIETTTSADTDTDADESSTVSSDESTGQNSNNDLSTEAATTHQVIAIASSEDTSTEKSSQSSSSSSSSAKSSSSSSGTSTNTNGTTVRGTITALPGTFGDQIAYIDSMQLYFYHADWPELALGDTVTVTGEPSEAYGEARLKIASADDIIITGHATLNPTATKINALSDMTNGALVTINGNVVEKSGDKIKLSDETGEITVVAHSKTNVSWSALDGATLEITGIVRRTGGELRLYPRTMSDVEAEPLTTEDGDGSAITGLTASEKTTPWLGYGLLVLSVGALTYWYLRARSRALAPLPRYTSLPLKTLQPNNVKPNV